MSGASLETAGKGFWFGAFSHGELIGDLGIYFEDHIARYQNIETHPRFRKKGVCATLVFQSQELLRNKTRMDTFVIHADPNYQAVRIYESLGFQPTEHFQSLSWWKGKKTIV